MTGNGERVLGAIMFTDVVGYVSLTERDEAAAIRVRDRHIGIVEPLVKQFHGELIDSVGDESLSIFPSAIQAVDCALAIQASLRQDQELRLRIGIHLGDVVRRGGEVVGEGVNVAARVRPLAEPGGICISEPVQQMVRSRSHVRTRSLGSKALASSRPSDSPPRRTACASPTPPPERGRPSSSCWAGRRTWRRV